MNFKVKSFIANDANDGLWGPILNEIHSFPSPLEQASLKIAASDAKDNKARAVMFFCDSPPPPPLRGFVNWYSKSFNDNAGYEQMYQDCSEYLNYGGQLNDTQKYYSRIVMTNARGAASTLTLFYPVLV